MTFSVLYVCTGNICRSPIAERLFLAWTDPSADVAVDSCGIAALVGEGIDPSSAAALGQLGVDAGYHKAQLLQDSFALNADLILTAGRTHRDYVIRRAPQVYRRAFTMKEFARLVRETPRGLDPPFTVAAAAARRGETERVQGNADDVLDPFRGSISRAQEIAEEISATVRTTIAALGFSRPRVDAG
ncbi:MAG TPA: hypothetical protein VK816_09400 [Jatrophihabitantaceae bacterium]|nr:hypothetical protein [Jatrophihabitantaceae bacterium]